MRNKRIFLFLVLIFVLLSQNVFAKSAPIEATDKPSHHEALLAAANLISSEFKTEGISNWNDKKDKKIFKIEEPRDIYDPTGNLVAYLVNVLVNKQEAGHVLVSAFYDVDPILAWADGGKRITEESEKEKLGDKKSKIKSSTLIWVGGDSFVSRHTLIDGSKVIAKNQGEIVPDDVPPTDMYPIPTQRNDNARQLWEQVKTNPTGAPGSPPPINSSSAGVYDFDPASFESNISQTYRGYIDTSVNMAQFSEGDIWDPSSNSYKTIWSGCAPTAGSNIIKYWATLYTSLDPTNNQYNITNDLRTSMGTTTVTSGPEIGAGSTYTSNIPTGLQSYSRSHGLPNAIASNFSLGSAYSNYSTITNQVDLGRPSLLNMQSQPYYGDHTITVVGYKRYVHTNTLIDSYYIVVRNNWGDGRFNEWVVYGNWSSASLTILKPNGT
jgi:hypothetical protein